MRQTQEWRGQGSRKLSAYVCVLCFLGRFLLFLAAALFFTAQSHMEVEMRWVSGKHHLSLQNLKAGRSALDSWEPSITATICHLLLFFIMTIVMFSGCRQDPLSTTEAGGSWGGSLSSTGRLDKENGFVLFLEMNNEGVK